MVERARIFRARYDAAVALLPKASAALVSRYDDDAIVTAWARDLTRATALWLAPSHRKPASLAIPVGALHIYFAGAEVAPWVTTVAMINGWGGFHIDDTGAVSFEESLWSCVGGFDLGLVTGKLADAVELHDNDDDDTKDDGGLAHLDAMKECARLKICELCVRGIERAAPALTAIPHRAPLTFFGSAHDDDKELLCAL